MTKVPWFLPDFFPSDLDGTLSASFLCTLLSKFLVKARSRLSNFMLDLMALPVPNSASQSSSDLWPCSLPPSLSAPRTRLAGRRRSRWLLRTQRREVTRQFIAACNWLVLGRPAQLSQELAPLSAHQISMVERLEWQVMTWLRLGHGPKRGLTRSVQKFAQLEEQLYSLHEHALHVHRGLQHYNKTYHTAAEYPNSCSEAFAPQPVTKLSKPCQAASSMRINPDRLKFDLSPQFDARPYLADPLLKAGFADPGVFRGPANSWPRPRLAKVQGSRAAQLALYRKWDSVGALFLLPADESEFRYRCGLFAVYKDECVDRQILNPIPENGRSFSISDATLGLAHASLLCNIYIPTSKNMVISSDDLRDFYHNFKVSDKHAARNHLHGVFNGSLFEGCEAFRPELAGRPVVGCFRTLAMGTNFAVETAQHAHSVLLRRAGCLRASEQVAYRHPLPRGPGFELLCIDDHAYLLIVDATDLLKPPAPLRRDVQLFARAARKYAEVGLLTSPKKEVRNAYSATVLGGEIDGIRGDIAAPRLKTVALCALTLQLVFLGYCTKNILETILGSWIFVTMFRRPTMCLLGQLFHELRYRSDHEIFSLSMEARQELLLLVVFAPFMFSDLRASPSSKIYATDASPFAAGICSAKISAEATLEIQRHADHRGFYTHLRPELSSYLDTLAPEEPVSSGPAVPASLKEGILYDVCEVYRGEGNLSAAFAEAGFVVHPGFDLADGPSGDVLQSDTMLHIIGLVCRRVVAYFHVAPVCTTFGTMRRPRLRSKRIPWGFDHACPVTVEGNRLAIRAAFILHLCASFGLLATAEQPLGSVMYMLWPFRELARRGFFSIKFSFCSFGTPFQKASHWLGNNEALIALRSKCNCPLKGKHLRLEGAFSRETIPVFRSLCRPSCSAVFGREPAIGEPLCRFSGSYPLGAMRALVELQKPAIAALKTPSPDSRRPPHVPARWIGDLGCCLPWKTVIQYRFKRLNHININEELALRSLFKHIAKSEPGSRFCVLLDSRVVIGCNAKGRSSSQKLNFYLSTCLPYILGGNLFPALLHIGTHENVADDPSRLKELRETFGCQPFWLELFLGGRIAVLDLIKLTDDCGGALQGWARFSVCLLLREVYA